MQALSVIKHNTMYFSIISDQSTNFCYKETERNITQGIT